MTVSSDLVLEPPVIFEGDVIVYDKVRIGKYSSFGYGKIGTNVTIGRFCAIADNFLLGAVNHPTQWLSINQFFHTNLYGQNPKAKPYPEHIERTTIGNDVWIGKNVTVLCGLTVGDGAVLGAGTVVTEDIPAYAIVVGNPAKVVKFRFDEATRKQLVQSRWWDLDEVALRSLPYTDIDACLRALKLLRGFSS
ncbi:MAG TPA: CatB-related O-acetyltransferase [Candidatus Dormibacteraeota bacterium]|nr:CatB-related O-acetyltransferase [Candidatus Dormibacteraeota bacterium]